MGRLTCCLVVSCLAAVAAVADEPVPTTIEKKTDGLKKLDGYFPLYWDERAGKLWLEISRFEEEFLYLVSLPAGIGSNDIGLDRGQLGRDRLVVFERVGPKVLLVQPNYRYRAVTENRDEQRAVADSFARSVLWGFEVAAEGDGRVLVDATEFCLRDAHGVAERLKRSEQGTYKLDDSRSAVYSAKTKNFPKNTEMEVMLTFTGRAEGAWIRQVTPSSDAVTVRQRHSFIQLPEPGYAPRIEAASMKLEGFIGAVDRYVCQPHARVTQPRKRFQIAAKADAAAGGLLLQHFDKLLLFCEPSFEQFQFAFDLGTASGARGCIYTRELHGFRTLESFEFGLKFKK